VYQKTHHTKKKDQTVKQKKIKMNTVFPLQMASSHKPMANIGEASTYIPHREKKD
jgi:hypothetical protein